MLFHYKSQLNYVCVCVFQSTGLWWLQVSCRPGTMQPGCTRGMEGVFPAGISSWRLAGCLLLGLWRSSWAGESSSWTEPCWRLFLYVGKTAECGCVYCQLLICVFFIVFQVNCEFSGDLEFSAASLKRLQWLIGGLRHQRRMLLSTTQARTRALHNVRFPFSPFYQLLKENKIKTKVFNSWALCICETFKKLCWTTKAFCGIFQVFSASLSSSPSLSSAQSSAVLQEVRELLEKLINR